MTGPVSDELARPLIGVALKWVPLHVEVDRLTGAVHADARFAGCSAADQAALEWGLRLADAWGGSVVVAAAGPAEAEALLRDGLAAGAADAVRVDQPLGAASEEVAAALALALGGADLVLCGDHSIDRGSGSVPAFLAARLDWAQALGLVALEAAEAVADVVVVTATRRLDHGRREVLEVAGPAVLSFEGGTAELRRAPLAGVLAARSAAVTVLPRPGHGPSRVKVVRQAPYRPRPRVLPAPSPELGVRERILSLTGALVERTPPRTVVCGADEAADLVLDQLRAWGYLE